MVERLLVKTSDVLALSHTKWKLGGSLLTQITPVQMTASPGDITGQITAITSSEVDNTPPQISTLGYN